MVNIQINVNLIAIIAIQLSLVTVLPERPVHIRLVFIIAHPNFIAAVVPQQVLKMRIGGRINNRLHAVIGFQLIQ